MRKILIFLMLVLLLCSWTMAAYEIPQDFTGRTLEDIMAEFMEANQLTERNFSISYYNTVTGESFDFNEKKFAIAASTYKLPLNMCFYEMEQSGQIDPNEKFRYTGMTLTEIHEESIVHSNNEVSEAMTGYWNNYYIYKENMRKYSSMPVEEIAETYYETNHSCTRIMMDTLKYLYTNSQKFEELIGYMKISTPGRYFQAGVQEYEVAHKYGEVNEFVNDVGIIYTPQPILLAVYTQGIYGAGVCADAARLLTNYVVWQTENAEAVSVQEPAAEENTEKTTEETTEEIVEETVKETVETPVEEPVQETEEIPEETPVEETEETPEEEPKEPAEENPYAKSKKEKTKWAIIGIGSILVVAMIPVLLRKRV